MKDNKKRRIIEIYADWIGLEEPTMMGTLYSTLVRGKEIFAFEYEHEWLRNPESLSIDPSLELFPGPQYPSVDQQNFGIFLDSSPDRWGRALMDRREALLARQEQRQERKLLETDYLLGVFDAHRIGGLRYRIDSEGPFLSNDKLLASPPGVSLRELENACLELEKPDSEEQQGYRKWLQLLIAPGGSLGGARPKASVIDNKNHLWIAKFPSNFDRYDVGAWEMLVYKLSQKANISVPPAKLDKFNSRHHTFISKRFDRTEDGKRLHYASAMTLLRRSDGDDGSNGVSYLDLAEFIVRFGANPREDLEQLWRRIVFYICVSNVDDHLRNHGFILYHNGWRLSPAFDINPVETGEGLRLNISQTDNAQDISLAKDVAEHFRIKTERADIIVKEVKNVVREWRAVAESLGIPQGEQSRMANAFRIANKE